MTSIDRVRRFFRIAYFSNISRTVGAGQCVERTISNFFNVVLLIDLTRAAVILICMFTGNKNPTLELVLGNFLSVFGPAMTGYVCMGSSCYNLLSLIFRILIDRKERKQQFEIDKILTLLENQIFLRRKLPDKEYQQFQRSISIVGRFCELMFYSGIPSCYLMWAICLVVHVMGKGSALVLAIDLIWFSVAACALWVMFSTFLAIAAVVFMIVRFLKLQLKGKCVPCAMTDVS